ncbi:CPBP family intramembrane glutamic endopeptidase [Lactiplantibacillus herbarum]|uniref:CPBP family intramembrane glutamic endopeptidase n=1 Tax=Lactiplantibacillus herbarum TaxID=1670446 RepID=UPI00064FD205|nr:CPBP family intramembrane glutamic endopeptidase [Lactiplantibacillus herbarum]
MRQLRLIGILWLTVLSALIIIGLLFKTAPFSQLPSLVTIGFQESLLTIFVLILNDRWLHQPVHYRSAQPWDQQLTSAGPTLVIAILISCYGLITATHFTTIVSALLMAGFISFFEETFFRGIIFQSLRTSVGLVAAAIISSLLFSLTHLINLSHQSVNLTILQLIFTFVLGLLLCGLAVRTQSLWWPIGIHAANDFFSLLQPPIKLPLITSTASFQVLEIIVVLILIWILNQSHKTIAK